MHYAKHGLWMVVCNTSCGVLPVWMPRSIVDTIDKRKDVAHCRCHYHYHGDCHGYKQECKGAAGQETSQQAFANQPQHAKASSKKKQRGGKKAAAKGSKGARTASGSAAQAADSDEEGTIEFFVPADENETDFAVPGGDLIRRQKVFHTLIPRINAFSMLLPCHCYLTLCRLVSATAAM